MLASVWNTFRRLTVNEEEAASNCPIVDPKKEKGMRIRISPISKGIGSTAGACDTDGVEKIQSTGTITVYDVLQRKAVIDRVYKVDVSKFPGLDLERGTIVDYEITRAEKNSQWIVTSICLHQKDKGGRTTEEPSRFKNLVVKVINVVPEFIEVEIKGTSEVMRIPHSLELYVGFGWMQGDWMQLHLENVGKSTSSSSDRILSIAPVQRKTVMGKVTKMDKASIIIDDTIFFATDLFNKGFPIGTVVKCDVISSDQSLSNENKVVQWRALAVEKWEAGLDEEDFFEDVVDDSVKQELRNHFNDLIKDKCGIQISPRHLRFPALLLKVTSKKMFTVVNKSSQTYCLQRFQFSQDHSVCQLDIRPTTQHSDGSITFRPNDEVVFEVSCTPLMLGKTTELCLFDFGSFMIARHVSVVGIDKDDQSIIIDKTRNPQNFSRQIETQGLTRIIDARTMKRIGSIMAVRAPFFCPKKIPMNPIPKNLFQMMKNRDEEKMRELYPNALEPLTFKNYKEKFQLGLWFEEMENEIHRRQYDLHSVRLEKCNRSNNYKFQAPGILDYNPPVMVNDTIDAFETVKDDEAEAPKDRRKVKYQGTILKIVETEVTCVFGDVFDKAFHDTLEVTIQFNVGRSNYKRCHFATQTALKYLGEEFLFPKEVINVKPPRITTYEDEGDEENQDLSEDKPTLFSRRKSPPKSTPLPKQPYLLDVENEDLSGQVVGRRARSLRTEFISDTASTPSHKSAKLKWFNKTLNVEQKDAVRRILRGQARPLPYIIYGPPGTGKTVTLVEAIMQLNKLDTNSRILVCGPSNASADVIAEYLAKSNQYYSGDFVRLNGFRRANQPLLESIAQFCADGEDLEKVVMNRLIISTCTTSGQFFSLGLQSGHFTHVFIDEAGFCTEPETMIPTILLALAKGGQLIMAGDPNQLGPVLMSRIAQVIGLEMSLLERLMTSTLYSRDEKNFPVEKYNPLVVTKLVKNYRAHPLLLKIPSRVFYDDELEPKASYENALALCQDPKLKDVLARPGVPLIFHGVQGSTFQEAGSLSFCNKAEALQICHYVTDLVDAGLGADDIGIITPYRKQVEKIRHALECNVFLQKKIPKVASVEEFQGGERKVIIISTVKSTLNEQEVHSRMGSFHFVFQPKRFNVAITRAKALLIIVGNPHVLAKNENWLQLLRFAIDMNVYKGCNLPIHLDRNVRGIIPSVPVGNELNICNDKNADFDEDCGDFSLGSEDDELDF